MFRGEVTTDALRISEVCRLGCGVGSVSIVGSGVEGSIVTGESSGIEATGGDLIICSFDRSSGTGYVRGRFAEIGGYEGGPLGAILV